MLNITDDLCLCVRVLLALDKAVIPYARLSQTGELSTYNYQIIAIQPANYALLSTQLSCHSLYKTSHSFR